MELVKTSFKCLTYAERPIRVAVRLFSLDGTEYTHMQSWVNEVEWTNKEKGDHSKMGKDYLSSGTSLSLCSIALQNGWQRCSKGAYILCGDLNLSPPPTLQWLEHPQFLYFIRWFGWPLFSPLIAQTIQLPSIPSFLSSKKNNDWPPFLTLEISNGIQWICCEHLALTHCHPEITQTVLIWSSFSHLSIKRKRERW